jgi:glycosyltransferase involved in cell wall biosynthesis
MTPEPSTGAAIRVSVVIPTLNEEKNLRHVLPLIPDWVDEVLIVDGRSKDGTVAEALRLVPEARIVLETRPGKGHALMAGFHAATGDIIVMLDADGSMDPGEIPSFVFALLGGADYVKGSRFAHGGGTRDMEWYRRLGNWGLGAAVRVAFGGRYSDLCYGYNAFWRDVVPFIAGEVPGFEVETYMNCRALAAGLRIVEVPSVEAERIHGVSNLRTFRDGFRVLITIFREWRTHRDGWVVVPAGEGVEDTPLRAGVAEPAPS